MATYLYNAVTTLVLGEEEDDPSCLKDPVTMSLRAAARGPKMTPFPRRR